MARYLLALEKVRGGLAHEARNQLGGVTIQLDLIGELMLRGDPGDPAMGAQIEGAAIRASRAARAVLPVLERLLGQTERLGTAPAPLDLRDALRRVEGLVVPFLVKNEKKWKLELPEEPVPWEGDRDALRDALVVVGVEAGELMAKGGCLELRLDPDGTLSISGSPPGEWVGFLRDTMGVDPQVKTAGGITEVQVQLSVQTRATGG